MKRRIILLAIAALFCASPIHAQSSNIVEQARYFLRADQMPDVSYFLPGPPAFGTEAFLLDSCIYEQGKRLRDTERGKLAIADANISIDYIMERFGKAMEIDDFTPGNYPVTADFLLKSFATARLSISEAKDKYARVRPYQHFGEHTPIPEKEYKDDFTSYPSGHTIRYWTAALVLTALDPEHQNEILKVGYEGGESRTIVGFHYQSDVDAARLAASAAYARLTADPLWQKLYKRSLKEIARKKSK